MDSQNPHEIFCRWCLKMSHYLLFILMIVLMCQKIGIYFSSIGIKMSNFLPTAVKFNEFGLFRLALPGFPDRIDPDPGSSSSQSSSLISLKEVKIR